MVSSSPVISCSDQYSKNEHPPQIFVFVSVYPNCYTQIVFYQTGCSHH